MTRFLSGSLFLPVCLVLACGATCAGERAATAQLAIGTARGTLSGIVLETVVHEPVPGALVTLAGQSSSLLLQQTTTDSRGRFEFEGLTPGSYAVDVHLGGVRVGQAIVEVSFGRQDGVFIFVGSAAAAAKAPDHKGKISVRELSVPEKARKEFANGLRELNERNQPAQACARFSRAVQLFPDYDEAYVQWALALIQLNQLEEATTVLARAADVFPGNARAHAILGKLFLRQGKTEEAIRELRRAIDLDPAIWNSHLDLARAFLSMRDFRAAEDHARCAHQINPQVVAVHTLLFQIYLENRRFQDALDVLDDIAELDAGGPMAEQARHTKTNLLRQLDKLQD